MHLGSFSQCVQCDDVTMRRLPPKMPRHPGGYREQAPHQDQPSAVSATPATQKVCRRHQAPCLPRDEARHQSQPSAAGTTPATKGTSMSLPIGAMRAKEKVRRCHQVPRLCKVPRRPGRPSTRYVNVTKWCHSCDGKCRATNATRASPVP